MSQSPVSVSYPLAEVLGRIEGKLDSLKEDVNDIKIELAEIKGEIKAIDSRLKIVETSIQKIPDLAEKVGELKNWRQIAVITVTAFISGIVTWLIRGGYFKP